MIGQLRGKALWASLATLIDAEGAIFIVKDRTHYRIQIGIGNVCKEWLDCWQLRVGRGCVQKGEQPNGCKRVWRLMFNRKADVAYILKRISPYLFIKTEQARLGLEFIEKVGIYDNVSRKGLPRGTKVVPMQELAWREECRQRMRSLNAKGNPERLYVEHPSVDGDIVRAAEIPAESDDNALTF